MDLKYLKYYDPISNAERVVSKNISRKISFAWCVEKTLKMLDR